LDFGTLVVVSIISFELSPLRIFPTQTLAKLVWGIFLDFSITLGGVLGFYAILDVTNLIFLSLRLCIKKYLNTNSHKIQLLKVRGQPDFGATPLKWMCVLFPHILPSSPFPHVTLKTTPKP
jgi:hypothetical protein